MTRAGLVLVVMAAAMGCGSKGAPTEDAEKKPEQPPEPTVLERARRIAAVDADIVESSGDGAGGILIVIGENHASVRAQLEVENILAGLRGAGLLDAVAIEGSNGPLPIHTGHIQEIARLAPGAQRAHARELVRWGEISGVEAFAIANPSIPHVGVEDMGAKARWELAQEEKDEATAAKVEQQRRDEIERAVACLGEPAAKAPGVVAARRRLVAAQQRLVVTRSAWTAAMAKLKPLHERDIALRADAGTMAELNRIHWAQIQLQIEDMIKKQRGDTSVTRDLEHSLALVKNMFPDGVNPITNPSPQTVAAMTKLFQLTEEGDRVRASLGLDKLADKLGAASEEVADAFAEVGSELGQRDDAAQRCSRRVVRFVSEVIEPELEAEDSDLIERDEPMVRDSLALRRDYGRVAMIVGSKHLPDITERLKQRGAAFLAVAVKSHSAQVATWERRAWEHRQQHQDPVFVAGLRKRKEVPVLVDASWWLNFGERARIAEELTGKAVTRGRVVRERAGQRVIQDVLPDRKITFVTGDVGLGPTVDAGSHVSSRGAVPGAGILTGFDEEAARKIVATLSDRQTHFGYARLADGGDRVVIDVPAPGGKTKELGLPELASGGAGGGGGRPRRVVVLDGMDAESSRQLARDLGTRDDHGRPLWDRLASESVLFTVNPERAAKNLRRLAKQEAHRLGGVRVVRGAGIEHLLPTPARGDNARTVVIVARNVPEFRAAVERAASNGLLEHKQIVLVTCGDAFKETVELREQLLSNGAAMVWVPRRQISEGLGELLASEVERTVTELPAAHRGAQLDVIMNRTIDRLKAQGGHPEIPLLDEPSAFVMRLVLAWRETA
jgi:hypothetical protein